MFTLPKLPYALNALAPILSEETLQYHYGKHHQAYVDKLNLLIKGTSFENQSLEEVILNATGTLFNNAAQTWNHTFYFNSLTPTQQQTPPSATLVTLISSAFGSLETMKAKFNEVATNTFGSGWAWLVQNLDSSLEIISTSNADNPLKKNQKPLLTCDVWEHAYYIDYRNARVKYLGAFWSIVNWNAIEKRLS